MNFKLGDFVRFVDERREGFITRIISDSMVGVTDADDFEIPVQVTKITHVHGQHTNDPDDLRESSTVLIPEAEFKGKGIFLAVINDLNKGSVVHLHVVNTTSYQLLCSLKTEKSQQFKGEYLGIINPATAIKLYSASLPELDLWPEFTFQIILYSAGNTKSEAPLVVKRKFKGKDFSDTKKQAPLLNKPAWLIQLDEPELIIDVQKIKESFYNQSAPSDKKPEVANPGTEVDLHIEVLRDDHHFLDSNEMLTIQLDHFRRSLDAAIVHKMPSIVFIHGVGNGTLSNQIHKLVSKHPQVQTFKDARKEKFGYGATEVIFKT